MRYTLTILILTVVAAVVSPNAVYAQRSLNYEPAAVELNGRLVTQLKYGPPNFGEQPKTDKKFKVPILVLTQPVNVLAKQEDGYNTESVYGATKIQLVFFDGAIDYKKLIGKNVVVNGTLFHAHTGHHYTDVLMKVGSIKLNPPRQKSNE